MRRRKCSEPGRISLRAICVPTADGGAAALLSAVPKPDPRLQEAQIILSGEVANPADPPSGCYFHPRCKYAQDRCKHESPELREVLPGHHVSCHFAEELELEGVSL